MTKVTIQSLPDHDYTLLIDDGRHALVADEAEDAGGDDLGPGPYALLLASLGACTAMTLFMYARRREWALYEVAVSLSHEKVFARDCEYCTQEEIDAAGPEGRIDVIQCEISVRGELAEAETARLLEISERCPVHRTLMTAPKIVSSIVAGR